ncbi:transport and Golgi organization protein 6 [Sabethes cyaneus]|uniref:transport and Golgi organization protein 6 n=1 Tax=Sabethes cyaneus TaxID=53552 RepID=UPI00237DEE05|nr:transport and Golgi organization protein 6 [Sabethes cyaneus]
MLPKSVSKIIGDLAAADVKDLSISGLQAILSTAAATDDLNALECNTSDPLWNVSIQYLHAQQCFLTTCLIQKASTPDGDDLINLPEQTNFVLAVDRIRQFTLNLYLPKQLRGLTRCDLRLAVQLEPEERIRRLRFCLEAFRRMFETKIIALQSKLENCILDYVAGVFGYSFLCGGSTEQSEQLGELFESFGQFSLEVLFKSLLVIKGTPNLPLEVAKQVHRELLRLTGEAGGFPVLCKTLLCNVPSDETPTWKKSEIIGKIVGSKGHTKKFYRQVLRDCFSFYEVSLFNEGAGKENLAFASTCIECLKQIYLLPPAYEELRSTIKEYFLGRFKELVEPSETLSGTILLERSQLMAALYLNYMAFSGSTCASLNSGILVPYVRVFLELYSMIPKEVEERQYLQTLIVFCLANRERSELESIVEALMFSNEQQELMKYLHPRINLKTVEDSSATYTLQIGPERSSSTDEGSLGPVLVEILKDANRNLLIYDVFVIMLKLFDRVSMNDTSKTILNAEEQDEARCKLFLQKYALIQALMELVNHKQFHSQLYENPAEILTFIRSMLLRTLEKGQTKEDLLEVVLSIFQEYLQRLHTRDDVREIFRLLLRLRDSDWCSTQLKSQIDVICSNSSGTNHGRDNLEVSPYQNALSLCSDSEPYCKVYGTTLMLRLLKERDKETLANKHAILILALNNLRNVESYAFLNSVRLLVALCDCLEAETLEALVKEYQSGENEVDYRLKVGEALVKTVEAVGPIAFRYRELLINCFLNGCGSSPDEFRASSLANLGNVCRILSYQVHHFFYEMFLMIKSVIETDRFLPARRAAILVLSQLVEGMDNLLTFQDYLLAVYRFLKLIVETERDEVTRLQASVALDHLSAKTKDFLDITAQTSRLEKEIRIFGIKEQQAEERRLIKGDSDSILKKLLD